MYKLTGLQSTISSKTTMHSANERNVRIRFTFENFFYMCHLVKNVIYN